MKLFIICEECVHMNHVFQFYSCKNGKDVQNDCFTNTLDNEWMFTKLETFLFLCFIYICYVTISLQLLNSILLRVNPMTLYCYMPNLKNISFSFFLPKDVIKIKVCLLNFLYYSCQCNFLVNLMSLILDVKQEDVLLMDMYITQNHVSLEHLSTSWWEQ
jgi:hypothetical protein